MPIKMEKSREKIFQRFIYNKRLKFSQLLKQTKISSNLLAYFLKKMIAEGMLEHTSGAYKLTERAEKLIPFFTPNAEMISPLAVVLVALLNESGQKILLLKRDKRPYKGFWSILSGRLLISETIAGAAKRIVKEKAFCEAKICGIKSVVYERLVEADRSKHGFVFFLVEAAPANEKRLKEKDFLRWFNIKEIKKREVIASDYWMIKEHLGLNTKVFEETINEHKKTTTMKVAN